MMSLPPLISATSINVNLSGTATVPYNPTAPATIIGKIDNTIQFPGCKVNSTKVKAFNIKTTDITSAMNVAVSGTDAAMFTVSATTLTKDAVNAGTNITVTYKPTAVGVHTATLTISGGGLSPDKVITLQGEGK